MKIKEKEIYKALPEEIKEMLTYIFNDYEQERMFFKGFGFKSFKYQDGVIVEAEYDDSFFNIIKWELSYKGINIIINSYSYDKENKFYYFHDKSDNNLKFWLEDSIIDDYVKVIKIDNSHKGIKIWE